MKSVWAEDPTYKQQKDIICEQPIKYKLSRSLALERQEAYKMTIKQNNFLP